jgi:hypothetical protein
VAIVLSCECGRKLQIAEEFAGQDGQCPSCGRTMLIPADGEGGPAISGVQAARSDSIGVSPLLQSALEPPAPRGTDRLTNHGGGPLAADSDFFADAPEEIGPIFSAHTTLRANATPWSAGARLIATGLAGFAGLAAGSLIVLVARPRAELWHIVWPTAGCALAALLARIVTRFSHVCTYVGRDGVARFSCAGTRERIVGSEPFLFRDAAELRTSQTVRYNHGSYQGTDYTFTWADSGGRTRYAIVGTYRNAKGFPPTTDAFHYGRAAETAWTTHLLGRMDKTLQEKGYVDFALVKGRRLRLRPGFLTMEVGGEPVEWAASEIGAIAVDRQTVKIKRADAEEGWFSSTGVVKFSLDSFGNAQLFFRLAERMLGLHIR